MHEEKDSRIGHGRGHDPGPHRLRRRDSSSAGSAASTGSQSAGSASNVSASDFKVGAIYINKKSDTAGYTYAHHTGITKAMEALGMDVDKQLFIVDEVPEDDTQVGAAVDTLVGEGCNIIFLSLIHI